VGHEALAVRVKTLTAALAEPGSAGGGHDGKGAGQDRRHTVLLNSFGGRLLPKPRASQQAKPQEAIRQAGHGAEV